MKSQDCNKLEGNEQVAESEENLKQLDRSEKGIGREEMGDP